MKKSNRYFTALNLRALRRLSQVFFLLLFLFLLINTQFTGGFSGEKDPSSVRLPYPVNWFLEIDPLAAVGSALASHTLYKGMIWSLVIIIPVLFLGRFFCGWVCPMGTMNQGASYVKSGGKFREWSERNRYRPWQKIKYYIFWGMMAAALFTTLQFGLLDPISLATRSLGLAYLPAVTQSLYGAMFALYGSDIQLVNYGGDALNLILRHSFLSYGRVYYRGALILGIIFTAVLLLNRYIMRFWCRGICPLGALLAYLSRWSIPGMYKDHEKCIECMKCVAHCQGACEPKGREEWIKHECHLCMNCEAVCPTDVIDFRFYAEENYKTVPDLDRRRLIGGLAAGAAFLPLSRASGKPEADSNPGLIRPPGSTEENTFLSRCIKCGECMKVCPINALHPTFFEAGLEGLWSPVLVARLGYCEHTCVLCTTVCPTGAIEELTEERKVGKDGEPPVVIGTAFVDRGRCLPWAMALPCIVCEEHCPTSPKAIYLMDEIVFNRDREAIKVRQPYVDPELCTGCGICEYKCPVGGKAAIRVSSVGESRSPDNRILLQSSSGAARGRPG